MNDEDSVSISLVEPTYADGGADGGDGVEQLDNPNQTDDNRTCINLLKAAYESKDVTLLDQIIEEMVSKSLVVGLNKLHTAAGYGFDDLVKKYLEQDKLDPNCECSFNDLSSITPLHFCAGIGPDALTPNRFKCIEHLAKHGARIDHVTSRLDSPLHWATKLADFKVCEALVRLGADINKVNIDNCTCAHGAAFYKNLDILELLIDSKLDVNICDVSGKNILHLLCKDSLNDDRSSEETPGTANESFESSSNSNSKQPNAAKCLEEISAYRRSKQEKTIKIVNRLIDDHKMNVNAKDTAEFTPIMYACEQSFIELIETLHKHKADLNVCNSEGISCLLLGILHSSPKVVDYLIKNGFDLKCSNQNISYVTDAAYLNDSEILLMLLEAGCSINETKQDDNGVILNPLWAACERANQSIVELLLSKGAETIIRPDLNMTALHCNAMAQTESVAITKLLVEHGCPINLKTTSAGETPLFLATNSGFYEVIEYLIEKGVDPNDASPSARTCFQQAVFRGHRDIIMLLLNRGGYRLTDEDKNDLNILIMDLYQDNDVDTLNFLLNKNLIDKEKILECIKRVQAWQAQECDEHEQQQQQPNRAADTTNSNSVATLNELTLHLTPNQQTKTPTFFPSNLDELEIYLKLPANLNLSDDDEEYAADAAVSHQIVHQDKN